ncbi:MAG: metalloregulator ArsR/SmtB family transcription factor [Pseudomonadota bacterium]
MTVNEDQSVAMLSALAQQTRLQIFKTLVAAHAEVPEEGGLAAGALARTLDIAPSRLSFHLKEMLWNGLVTSRRAGRSVIYKANLNAMSALISYLLEDCCAGACDVSVNAAQPHPTTRSEG